MSKNRPILLRSSILADGMESNNCWASAKSVMDFDPTCSYSNETRKRVNRRDGLVANNQNIHGDGISTHRR